MQTMEIDQPEIYTVSRLNNEARFLLEDTYPSIWVEGEISNYLAHTSGHWYFSLKDASAQVKCAMFRGNQRRLGFTPKNGLHILVKARVSLYENRGDFQLIVEFMEERGEGKLRRAYEELKKKLEAAGLFDPALKKELPAVPKQIGIITSPTGAAIRDILTVLKRRYPLVPVIIYPALVQGSTAAPTIVNAINLANQRNECDVLIVARGGGSLEDLWPFNEEIVAHAIYKSKLPIVNAVGHEVDFTIADFVADLRAPTPSAAAEMVTPDVNELVTDLNRLQIQFGRLMVNKLSTTKQQLAWVQKHLSQQHPKRRLSEKMQRLDFCELTLVQLQNKLLAQFEARLSSLSHRLERQNPVQHIKALQHRTSLQYQRLCSLITQQLSKQQASLAQTAATLDAISPLATLKRGFAIASDTNRHVLKDVEEVDINDKINVQLAKGALTCRVEDKKM